MNEGIHLDSPRPDPYWEAMGFNGNFILHSRCSHMFFVTRFCRRI